MMTEPTEQREFRVTGATWGYRDRRVIESLTLTVPIGSITAVVGPNGCGKSTLLHGLARLLHPDAGRVILDDRDIALYRSKEVARRLGLLGQTSTAPDGITVADLVARGRYPYQDALRRWSDADESAVVNALRTTNTLDLAQRRVDELSGGQRQRVWIALVLAQQTPVILLDEPTTFLDIAHQLDVLDLLVDLNRNEERTIVLVLHDLNQAARYADYLVVMKDGAIVATGEPSRVVSAALVSDVFGIESRIITDEVSGTPLVLPIGRHHRSGPPDYPVDAQTTPPG